MHYHVDRRRLQDLCRRPCCRGVISARPATGPFLPDSLGRRGLYPQNALPKPYHTARMFTPHQAGIIVQAGAVEFFGVHYDARINPRTPIPMIIKLPTGDAIAADSIMAVLAIAGDAHRATKDQVKIQFRGDAQVFMTLEMDSFESAVARRDEIVADWARATAFPAYVTDGSLPAPIRLLGN